MPQFRGGDAILFEGEELDFSSIQERASIEMSDADINDKYIQGDIRIVTEQARYPLPSLNSMLASQNYRMDPEFQRRHRWNDAKKSRLIESFIMNVPIPPIFLYEVKYSYYEVMDGLQRLSAISDFYNDKFVLVGLEHWGELNGRSYSRLPSKIRAGIDRRYLSSIILLQETAKSDSEAQALKQLVFERINSGGVLLGSQEARNAIYPGPLNDLCIKLSRNKYFCRMWDIPEPGSVEFLPGFEEDRGDLISNDLFQKMTDVELVLRFFAYRQRLKNHRGSLKDYLDTYLREGNRFHSTVIQNLRGVFDETIYTVYQIFGSEAFWLYRNRASSWSWFKRPTTVVYDPMMFVVSQNLERRDELVAASSQIKSRLPDFYRENYGLFEGRYTNLSNITERNAKIAEFIDGFLL